MDKQETKLITSHILKMPQSWHFFYAAYGMSPNKSRTSREKKTEKPGSIKKIPSKKAPSKRTAAKKKEDPISIQLPPDPKNLKGIAALGLRDFGNSTLSEMPTDIKPMLATIATEAFNDVEWQFELKLDGYRALAYIQSGKAELKSRNNNSFNKKFEEIIHALKEWKLDAVVDGEITVLNEDGRPDFSSIQQWEKHRNGNLVYYVFDLLWVEGHNIMQEPLYKRRALLKQLVPDNGVIRFSDHIDEIGNDFFQLAKQNNLEGIVAKRRDAPYLPDTRTRSWLKIKAEQRHEAVICGYTRKSDTDRLFSSLILGIYKEGNIRFIGQVGTGFSQELQKELLQKMKPQITKKCPFESEPILSDKPVWLKPFLVCEVKYTELTGEGLMRHASFQGLREDKAAFELNTEELPLPLATGEPEEQALISDGTEENIIMKLDGHDLRFTNLKKIYWPDDGFSKGDLLNYYHKMADYMLPYMKDRPQSLNRFPGGIYGESFYHKNMGGKVDKWLKTFERFSESSGEAKDFLICTDAASLLYMANLGCIEMNPWHSRVQLPHNPDWSVIDLDPGEISFEKVIETARVVKDFLDALQIPSWPKTSGSTGIHIYIPLGAKYNYEQSKQLAELIANLVHEELPEITSIIRNPQKRKDKIYIDYLQNRPIQTICAPYSLRPKPGAPASAPLHWDEVKPGLKIEQFHINNMYDRVRSEGDLFDGVLGKGIDLNKVLKGLTGLM